MKIRFLLLSALFMAYIIISCKPDDSENPQETHYSIEEVDLIPVNFNKTFSPGDTVPQNSLFIGIDFSMTYMLAELNSEYSGHIVPPIPVHMVPLSHEVFRYQN